MKKLTFVVVLAFLCSVLAFGQSFSISREHQNLSKEQIKELEKYAKQEEMQNKINSQTHSTISNYGQNIQHPNNEKKETKKSYNKAEMERFAKTVENAGSEVGFLFMAPLGQQAREMDKKKETKKPEPNRIELSE